MNLRALLHPGAWDAWCRWAHLDTPGSALGPLVAAHPEALPELAALAGVDQDPHWHPEGDVLVHVLLAADRAAQLCTAQRIDGEERTMLVLAALLHDVGKPTCTRLREGRITSRGHAQAGVRPARTFCERAGAPEHLVAAVGRLVAEHMTVHSTPTPSVGAVERLAARLAPVTLRQWALLVDADKNGRGRPPAPSPAEPWLRVAAAQGLLGERPGGGAHAGGP